MQNYDDDIIDNRRGFFAPTRFPPVSPRLLAVRSNSLCIIRLNKPPICSVLFREAYSTYLFPSMQSNLCVNKSRLRRVHDRKNDEPFEVSCALVKNDSRALGFRHTWKNGIPIS